MIAQASQERSPRLVSFWPAADSHKRLLPGRLLHAAAAGFAPTEEGTAASTKCRRLARDRRGHGSVLIVVRAAVGRT